MTGSLPSSSTVAYPSRYHDTQVSALTVHKGTDVYRISQRELFGTRTALYGLNTELVSSMMQVDQNYCHVFSDFDRLLTCCETKFYPTTKTIKPQHQLPPWVDGNEIEHVLKVDQGALCCTDLLSPMFTM